MKWKAPDFLHRERPPGVGWTLLVAGTLAMAGALYGEHRWALQREFQETAEQRAVAADLARQVPPRPAEPNLSQRRTEQVQRLLRGMRDPWLPTLRAVESATASPVFLLTLDIDPTKGSVKLDAEAPSFDHALAYVQMLDERGYLLPAQLVSHESGVDAESGRAIVRFSVVTRWVPR